MKLWSLIGLMTIAAGPESLTYGIKHATHFEDGPGAAQSLTHVQHHEHYEFPHATNPGFDDEKDIPTGHRNQDGLDSEDSALYQQSLSAPAMWTVSAWRTFASAYDELLPGQAPAWYWSMIDQGQELVRTGVDASDLGNMLTHGLLELQDPDLMLEMDLHYNGIIRALHQEQSRTRGGPTTSSCSADRAETYIRKVVGTMVQHWLHDGHQHRTKRPPPTPTSSSTSRASSPSGSQDDDAVNLMERWKGDKRTASPTRLWKELPDTHKTHTTRRLLPPWKKQNNPPLQPRPPPHPPGHHGDPARAHNKQRRCSPSPIREPRTPHQETQTEEGEEMTMDDAIAVWKALFEFEQLEASLGTQIEAPILPQTLVNNIVETLVDRAPAEHNLLVEALPLFVGKIQMDLSTATERARKLRRTLSDPGSSTDPPPERPTKGHDGEDNDQHEREEDEGDGTIYMQTDIRSALTQPSHEDLLLNKLHKSFLNLRADTASSRALRLMSLLQDHDGFLAVDRACLEALLVAVNSETPPLPEGEDLLIEHAWVNLWWARLRGKPQVDFEDAELELHYIEELQAKREREQMEAEQADQEAREAAYQRHLESVAEQHTEQMKASLAQQQEDAIMAASLGVSNSRPSKRLCIGICITDGTTTKAWDWELKDNTALQIHVKAEPRLFPGKWFKDGKQVNEAEIPQVLKEPTSSSAQPPRPDCHPLPRPRPRHDINKPATRELYERWRRGELSSQTLVSMTDIDTLTFFQALNEITEDELQDLETRETMNLAVRDDQASGLPAHSEAHQEQGPGECAMGSGATVEVSATLPEPEGECEEDDTGRRPLQNDESPDE